MNVKPLFVSLLTLGLISCTGGELGTGSSSETSSSNSSLASSSAGAAVSSSSSSTTPVTGGNPTIPVTIMAKDYDSNTGEDGTRQGSTTGPCAGGTVDLIDEGSQGCAIAFTQPDETVTYKVWANEAGRYNFEVAATTGQTEIDPYVDVLVNGDKKMSLLVKNNGWNTYSPTLSFLGAKFERGENTVTFRFVTGKTNLLWFKITPPQNNGASGPIGEITGDTLKGGEIWKNQCSFCHTGVDTPALADAALVRNTPTLELLVATNHASMPLGNPQSCIDQCAIDVSLFIEQSNPFFGSDEEDIVEVDRLGNYPAAKGSVVAHPVSAARLTINQFNNTVRDLLGTKITLPDDFPPDARIGLFDNNAFSLFVSLSHIKAFEKTLQEIVDEAFKETVPNPRVVSCKMFEGESCVRTMAKEFGERAWRRPLTNGEINKIVERYNTVRGLFSFNRPAFKVIMKSILMSPNFLYRIEIDKDVNATTPKFLNNYEVASRLSYFLWASMPDDALFEAAKNGELTQKDKLLTQVDRMLKDPKAMTLVDNFAAQWLDYPAALVTDRNPEVFPQYTESLQKAMVEETRQFIKHIFTQDRPIREIFSANYTFLNAELANLYGVSGVTGNKHTRYNWNGDNTRNGVLGHASVLNASAGASDNPAAVVRGTWVLDRVLCKHPRPPSADVIASFPVLSEDLVGRERVETHRTNPACASCHALMDPIGFGLDNFDSIGAWRDTAYGEPIDSSGDLPGGDSFDGAVSLKKTLAESAELPFCFANHLASYALGRKMDADGYWDQGKEPTDYPFIYDIYQQAGSENYRFSEIVKAIVTSDAFRKRLGANLAPTGAEK